MNRPYGAVDVAANLKGAVAKTAAQKILTALAERGELVQKTYGKTTFFVANQANTKVIPAEEITDMTAQIKTLKEENAALALQIKTQTSELAKVRSTPTDDELEKEITTTQSAVKDALARLGGLGCGTPIISAEDREHIETEWKKWRIEWVRRRKVFMTFWQLVTDLLTPHEAESLGEELGIEWDSPEHIAVERSNLCEEKPVNVLKRKR
ncbi:hypothetical protein AMATHDRAFT_190418 [Amanita thiersii Skay4041]|uniref:Homologous-pairing protein 2 winged helix domain-containing protein n=1 Tax=Amanita thiersii Skay4041 TaxID=703135 RepID=A0A2A9NWK0_9AGAR|nr:hypothetical protein AMATHDRAFT_190418 [Amanita thiersii Skay4041]